MAVSRRDFLTALGGAAALAALPFRGEAAPLAKVKELGALRVAVYKDNRPWSWRREGKLAGIDVDLAQAIAGKLGVRLDPAELTADEDVGDDLRNAVWRGGLLGFAPCDMMMHVPYDRVFASRNDQVAIIAPYYREGFALACGQEIADCEAAPVQFKGRRLAAEMDSIPDFYLMGSFGGALRQDVVHYPSGADAVKALVDGKADAAMASRAQIEAVLAESPMPQIHRRHGPLPTLTSPGWDIGMAVKENSRTLGDAVEDIVAAMTASGELKAIFARHGVSYAPPLAA